MHRDSGIAWLGLGGGLALAAVLGLLSALDWPLLVRLALVFTVLTPGIDVLAWTGGRDGGESVGAGT